MRKGNSQNFATKIEKEWFKMLQKSYILDGKTLTHETQSDAKRELPTTI